MKITCTTEHLKTAVLTVEHFTGRHVTLPILSYILITVKERKIYLSATNLEIGIEYAIPGKIQKPGTVTIPAKTLTQIIQSIPDETITLDGQQNKILIHTPSSDITILGLDPTDFPNLPTIKKEHSFSIPAEVLTLALHQVLPAVAPTDLKPQLSGVFMASTDEALVLAATDSFRLAEKTINHTEGLSNRIECIVPGRTMQELLRTLPSGGEVQVNVGENQVVFEWNETRILYRLIDGAYPPYKNIIPKSYETTIVVNREDLLKKIRLASVFSSRLNDVTLHVSPKELAITTANAESGGTTTRMPVKGRGASGAVVFNYRYLWDGIEAAQGPQVTLHINGISGPTLIQSQADPSFLYLLMPIRAT